MFVYPRSLFGVELPLKFQQFHLLVHLLVDPLCLVLGVEQILRLIILQDRVLFPQLETTAMLYDFVSLRHGLCFAQLELYSHELEKP